MKSLLLVGLLVTVALLAKAAEGGLTYPTTKRVEVVEKLHGVEVADPYRWLEEDVRVNKEVAQWVEDQNKVTFGYLEKIPARRPLVKRLTDLWNYERYSAPFKEGGRYFYFRNDGLQNQAVLYTLEKLDAEPRLLLDPNKLSKDGTIALGGFEVSPDGKKAVVSLSEAGSDWTTMKVLDIATGKFDADEIKWVKFSGASWSRDNKGFFYSRYDEPKEGTAFTGANKFQKAYYHVLGTPQSEDKLVYERKDQPDWSFSVGQTEDGKYDLLVTRTGTDAKYRVAWRAVGTEKFTDLIDEFKNEYSYIDNEGSVFLFKTDFEAPRGRVIAIDLNNPQRDNWKEIIPQAEEKLGSVSMVGGHLICGYLKDAKSLIKCFTPEGRFVREVKLPGIGSAGGFGGKKDDSETFYTFNSFAVPPTIYRYDVKTGESKEFRTSAVKFDPSQYVTEQVFYKSKDGTRVPMFLTYKKGLKKDGSHPTLLYGYGGFNISLPPAFSVGRIAWLEMGGVYAQANLRGGGEYGKTWHDAGRLKNKQNVFDDFIAAAEYLIAQKYTSANKLAIKGGSNGGLLVGACLVQRPDLFGACLPAVGVMDMLRFHKFTIGRYWVDDYGSPDDPEYFKILYAYSPYHNLRKGTKYPATLVTTGDTDDRVVPGHSFKFAAMLQYCQAGPAPVLIRIETRAGHGAGKPTAKIIQELADEYAFLVKELGIDYPAKEASSE
ncbi:MAG: prolyl oligopeptidase family serine peptidase [Gemmataceae bacterium]